MSRNPGFWLDPNMGENHLDETRPGWLLENAASLGLAAEIAGLDPYHDAKLIRLIGVRSGLVRACDDGAHISIQYYAALGQVPAIRADFSSTIEMPAPRCFLIQKSLHRDRQQR